MALARKVLVGPYGTGRRAAISGSCDQSAATDIAAQARQTIGEEVTACGYHRRWLHPRKSAFKATMPSKQPDDGAMKNGLSQGGLARANWRN